MTEPTRAQRAERAMRDLLRDNDLPDPDAVVENGDELVLLWHDRKVALVVELDG
jgi:sulfur carrier protein ThiS